MSRLSSHVDADSQGQVADRRPVTSLESGPNRQQHLLPSSQENVPVLSPNVPMEVSLNHAGSSN